MGATSRPVQPKPELLAQVRELFRSTDRVVGLRGDRTEKEPQPTGEVAALSDCLQTVVVLVLVLFEVGADVQQRFREIAVAQEEEDDQQSTESSVPVEKGVQGFELVV